MRPPCSDAKRIGRRPLYQQQLGHLEQRLRGGAIRGDSSSDGKIHATDVPNVTLTMGAFANNGGPTRTILPPAIATNNLSLAECIYATDQRGALRKPSPPGGKCDSGSVEVGGVIDEIFTDGFELP